MRRNKKNFVNIFTTIAVVAVAGYFLIKPKALQAEPLQQSPQVSFLKPQSGTVVNSGDVLSIEIEGQGLKEVMLIAPHFAQKALNDGSGLFKFQYPVPLDTVGELKLTAVGKSVSGYLLHITKDNDRNFQANPSFPNAQMKDLVKSCELTIIVRANQQINVQSLSVLSNFMVLKVGESGQIYVSGKLSDGRQINVIPSEFGTQYITGRDFTKKYSPSANVGTEIIRVDSNGNVTGVNLGEDSVVVSHKNTQAETVRVVVEE